MSLYWIRPCWGQPARLIFLAMKIGGHRGLILFTVSLRTVFALKFANRATDLKVASRDCCDLDRVAFNLSMQANHTAHSMTKYRRENK
jgi:hypothetical protein